MLKQSYHGLLALSTLGARKVAGNLAAPRGEAAILAEQRFQTEKVRVTDFLTLLLRNELTGPVTPGTLS